MEPLTSSGSLPVVPVIVGPTASGKTAVAIELARLVSGEIISADSRQIYKMMDIGTAKPTREERSAVKHHFIDELWPDEEFNAGVFGERARTIVHRLLEENQVPIIAGGSGLYIQSAIDGFFEGPGGDKDVRFQLEERLKTEGLSQLMSELERVDPVSAARIDPGKPRRVIRALEVYHLTGRPLSELHRTSRPEIKFTPRIFGLEWERKALYARINARCDQMIDAGLLNEIDALLAAGYGRSCNALNTVGYSEGIAFRAGEILYEDMLRLFKQNSRRYAKRQMTWFRRDERVEWIKMDDTLTAGEVAARLLQRLAEA